MINKIKIIYIINDKSKKLIFFSNIANICSSFPCRNGGTCSTTDNISYKCSCDINFYGDICENSKYLFKFNDKPQKKIYDSN